jgi:hypothetical protein
MEYGTGRLEVLREASPRSFQERERPGTGGPVFWIDTWLIGMKFQRVFNIHQDGHADRHK